MTPRLTACMTVLMTLLACLLAACASPTTKPVIKPGPAMTSFSQRDCAAVGGRVRPVGKAAMPTCVIPYLDAGKSCRDSAECMGMCITAPVAAGTHLKGTCSPDSGAVFGCYSEVKRGKALLGICVD